MNLFAISSILVILSTATIGFITLIKNNKSRIFSLFAFTATIWGLGTYKIATTNLEKEALFWTQVAYTGVILSPVFYAHFVIQSFLKLRKRLIVFVIYILSILFLFFNWHDNSRLFLGNLRFVFNQFYWHDWIANKNFLWLLFYISFYWFLLGYCFLKLLKTYKTIDTAIGRNQLKYIIIGSIVGWFGTEPLYFLDFNINLYPISNFLIALYPFVIAYAIIKYRLLDIKVAITRAGVFVIVYTIILGLPFAAAFYMKEFLIVWFGPMWWMAPLSLMAALATVGPFIYIAVERRAEETLLKEQRRYQDTLKQASVGMTRIRNLQRLLNLIAHIVTKTVKITYAAIYLHNKEDDQFVLQVSRDKGRQSVPVIAADNKLIEWILLKRDPLIYEEIKRQKEDAVNTIYGKLEEEMRLLTASVIIPSFLEDRLLGLIVLGDKVSGQIYTPEDLNVFQVLASQAALAIENAQFYEEAKEMQAQIAQAEKMATVGTMADGLSHQINNRFYALSLIAGDSIDTIKLTDTTSCSPEIKEMIKQVGYALERIQTNVMQGGEVVKGILKYTRKSEEGGTEALALDQIIDGTLDMVQYKVKLSEIDLIRNYPKELPKIKGNLVQLEEAFFNFIDNAYDAIVERRTTLKEPGYKGRITVSAQPKQDNAIEIMVEDNGMGIKEDNEKKVFTPFFTTKISSRKGTGLGLYVIRRIITEMHKGKLSFESSHGIGTRFIIELPIASQ